MYRITQQIFLVLSLIFFSIVTVRAGEYWQQEVNYRIDVTLKADLRTIEGTCRVQYINNSPDTLRELYIKAFPNAVQPGSYMDKKQRETGDYSFAKLKPEERGALTVEKISLIRPGEAFPIVKVPRRDNTIFRVPLGSALNVEELMLTYNIKPTGASTVSRGEWNCDILPGDTGYLQFNFTSILPSPHQARMGVFGGTSKAAYWYPAVCVYDRKLKWNNGQYLGWGEWYGDYGTFEVNITSPEDVIIAATGDLTNESEVLPDSLNQMLQLANFTKPRSEWPKFAYDTSRTKTWKFLAKTVPDFSFVASRNYCMDEVKVGDVRVIAYALRQNANRWKTAAEDGTKAIQTLSELYIPYQWPVMRICDAYGGMEFPMLVHCSGGPPSPGWYVVVWHEIAHNWFMGHVGSNQTDRPFLDEGFTTSAEHVIVEKYRGRFTNANYKRTWYAKKFAPDDEDRDSRGFRPLLLMMEEGYDKPMVFSYDQGEEYYPYRVSAYYKTAAMHYNLRSILGDSAYFKAMQDYCRKWLFKHPYEEDFAASMEQSTGLTLAPFFQEWYYGRDRLDYAFGGMKKTKLSGGQQYTITLMNRGRFVSPVDVAVIYNTGDTAKYTAAPEGMAWQKPGYTLLPLWNQFRRFDEEYQFAIATSQKIKKVVVDPQNLLMDIDRMNNQSGLPPVEARFDNMKFDRTPVNQYALRWRPDVWYDEPNGLQLGVHLHGSYLEREDRFRLDTRVGTKSGLPMTDFRLGWPPQRAQQGAEFSERVLWADHRVYTRVSYDKRYKKLYSVPDQIFFGADLESMRLGGEEGFPRGPIPPKDLPYLPDRTWDAGITFVGSARVGTIQTFRYGDYQLVARYSLGGHHYKYTSRGFNEIQTSAALALKSESRTWLKARAGFDASGGEPPSHRLNHLSRTSSMERFVSSPVFRSPGTFPTDWEKDFYLSAERVRGYQDRVLYFFRAYSGSVEVTPFGKLPIPLVRRIPAVGGFLSKLNVAAFVDAASISMEGQASRYRQPVASNETPADGEAVFASAGLSITMPPVWSNQQVRLDFPLYLSKPAAGDDKFEFRFSVAWVIPSLY